LLLVIDDFIRCRSRCCFCRTAKTAELLNNFVIDSIKLTM